MTKCSFGKCSRKAILSVKKENFYLDKFYYCEAHYCWRLMRNNLKFKSMYNVFWLRTDERILNPKKVELARLKAIILAPPIEINDYEEFAKVYKSL